MRTKPENPYIFGDFLVLNCNEELTNCQIFHKDDPEKDIYAEIEERSDGFYVLSSCSSAYCLKNQKFSSRVNAFFALDAIVAYEHYLDIKGG